MPGPWPRDPGAVRAYSSRLQDGPALPGPTPGPPRRQIDRRLIPQVLKLFDRESPVVPGAHLDLVDDDIDLLPDFHGRLVHPGLADVGVALVGSNRQRLGFALQNDRFLVPGAHLHDFDLVDLVSPDRQLPRLEEEDHLTGLVRDDLAVDEISVPEMDA